MLEKIRQAFQMGFIDDEHRKALLFKLLNIALGIVSLGMSVVNYFTSETTLMYVTLLFAAICFLNFVLLRFTRVPQAIMIFLFLLDIMILFTHFIVSGTPQGFSVLWSLMVPACALSIFGMRDGAVFCAVVFTDIAFLFWLPYGQSLLQWQYSETFMLRFPFVYICMFLIALYIEWLRVGTFKRLRKIEQKTRYLSLHDALTGLYNRHAFREELERIFDRSSGEQMAILMLDIDDFKTINDSYGHNMGDEVLRTAARLITENTCEHCISCRWGGEEFLVLMQCRHNPWEVGEKIRKAVEGYLLTYEGQSISFTVSVGVATAYAVGMSQISQFISTADKAMYASKSMGKNRTTVRAWDSVSNTEHSVSGVFE